MNDVMKRSDCPFCGGALEKGTLQSRGGVYFLPEGQKVPTFYTEESFAKRGAISLPPFFLDLWKPHFPYALACRQCGVVIVDYEKEDLL